MSDERTITFILSAEACVTLLAAVRAAQHVHCTGTPRYERLVGIEAIISRALVKEDKRAREREALPRLEEKVAGGFLQGLGV